MGAQGVFAFPPSDRDDEDYEDDGCEGDPQEDHGRKASSGQDGFEGRRQAQCGGHEEGGEGHLRPKVLSPELAAICGAKKLPRTEVTKKIWAYIKKNSLSAGRVIKPDSQLKAIFPMACLDMFKMPGLVSKHLS